MRVSAVLSKSAIALLGLTILLSGRPAAQTHIDGDGRGEGKIVLENYATQPVMLNEVRREKAS